MSIHLEEHFGLVLGVSVIRRVVAAKAWRQGGHLSMTRLSCLDK